MGANSKRLFTNNDRTVIVGTKNGDICTVDMRNPKVLHKFSAHDAPIRTLCIDSATDCLVTGGADGIVKVCLIDCLLIFNYLLLCEFDLMI